MLNNKIDVKEEVEYEIKVLIVDDNRTNLDLIASYFEDYNYSLLFATSGELALKRVDYAEPDIILLDILMPPGMNGFEVCKKLKSSDKTKDIPIIFMTAQTDTEDKVKGFELGAVDYITKPVQKEELLARMKTHLKVSKYQETLELAVAQRTEELLIANSELLQFKIDLEKLVEERTNKLSTANQCLEKTIKDLEKAQARLIESEKITALSTLTVGIAHEINTPTGIGITGASHLLSLTEEIEKEYLSDTLDENSFKKYLEELKALTKLIYENLNNVAHLTKTFKMITGYKESEEKEKLLLYEYLNAAIMSLQHSIKNTNIKINLECDENITLYSYGSSYCEIINNLVLNSVNHAYPFNEEGVIDINISLSSDNLILIYKDYGKGISQENISKVFEPFFTTNRGDSSMGLGLSIVYNIVTNDLNGTITCKSNEGEGVVFEIIVPVK